MYFGFDRNHRDLERAINQAIAKGVIVFAAASNSGQLGKITFPARMSQVIQINSADGNGNPSAFNPPPNSYTDNFSTLGEAVNSAWPLYLEERGTRRQSGTSVATSIAAGIAALILQYSRQHAEMLSPSILQRLASPDGMRAIFRYMSAERGIYANIVPWKLLGTGSTQRTVFQIQSVLEQEFGEN
jgi:subtilisin family serine protease